MAAICVGNGFDSADPDVLELLTHTASACTYLITMYVLSYVLSNFILADMKEILEGGRIITEVRMIHLIEMFYACCVNYQSCSICNF